METMEMEQPVATTQANSSRRELFAKAFGGAILAAAGASIMAKAANAQTVTDADILNFALNLEYLEGEFYSIAFTGKTLDQNGYSLGANPGSVVRPTTPQVSFVTPNLQALAGELYKDEANHVVFLQTALGASAVSQPNLDLKNSFLAAGAAIGVPGFDPYASETNFLLASYVFEDVGVTAYHGAAKLISNKAYLGPAAGILAIEAYHAAAIRTRIYLAGTAAQQLSVAISNLRATSDGTAGTSNPDDLGVMVTGGLATVADLNPNPPQYAIAFERTTTQVLNVVYGSAAYTPTPTPGSFFPNGMNGTIR